MILLATDHYNSISQFITVLLLFVVVVAITYWTSRWIGGYQKMHMTSSDMEVLQTCKITNDKFLQIVKVANKLIVIAVCKDSVTYLTELDSDAIDPESGDVSRDSQMDFRKILDSFGKKNKE
ncbi:MAG: flagellar biosynthetic protein FliO [Lachnospiraceae bacterium]|nr:flagellar biosynthetic protein FliO [Lachnospiraceae bacterium]